MGELLLSRHHQSGVSALDNYAPVRLRRWLRFKHKPDEARAGAITLARLRYFGLIRLSRLGHDVLWVKAGSLVREPDAGCVRRSWYELASASLVRPKPSKQDGSESYGLHGNVVSGA